MTAYDEIIYPSQPHADTHPDRLATIATLFGMTPAPVDHCRVLEVACGDAGNLIPMAYGLPDSEFVGFDLAARPIAMGNHMAARLGLANLTLRQLDLADFPADAGRFDYIVAHGLYSWVPALVRDCLLGLVASHLAPNGVAFVSYNVYPGCYMRRMVWEILKFHTDHLGDPQSRITEAQALTRLLAGGRNLQDAYGTFLLADLERLMQRDISYFFHDDLADINDPVYFHQFVDHAGRHGLQFLGEGELKTMGYGGLTPEVRRVLESLDPLTREQYLDFVRFRRFRQTLLCHAEVDLERQVGPDKVTQFLLGAAAGMRVRVSMGDAPQAQAPGAEQPAPNASILADEALLQALLDVLNEASPRMLSFDELTARVSALPEGETLKQRGADAFRQFAFGAARAGALELHVHAPALVTEPGERPLGSPVARLQLDTGDIVTSLCHDSVKLDNKVASTLLALLDGARSRAELVVALGDLLEGDDQSARLAALDIHLRMLGKLALLVA